MKPSWLPCASHRRSPPRPLKTRRCPHACGMRCGHLQFRIRAVFDIGATLNLIDGGDAAELGVAMVGLPREVADVSAFDAGDVIGVSGSADFQLFFQAEDAMRDVAVTGVQTCALPI